MLNCLYVGVGGFLGAVARYLLTLAFQRWAAFPFGTLAANLIGCFAIGAIMFWATESKTLSEQARLFIATGILGGLTTFSTFGYETTLLARGGRPGLAAVNIVVSLGFGLAGVVLGRWAARSI